MKLTIFAIIYLATMSSFANFRPGNEYDAAIKQWKLTCYRAGQGREQLLRLRETKIKLKASNDEVVKIDQDISKLDQICG